MSHPHSFKEIQKELGKRLKELRLSAGHGLNEQETAQAAKERGLKIGARTIAAWETASGSPPSLDKLWQLLTYYGVSLGDFFRFTISSEEAVIIADVLHVIRNPERRDLLKRLIAEFRRMK